MGGETAPVSSSGSAPACTTSVSNATFGSGASGISAGPRMVGEVLQQVQLRDDADRAAISDRQQRGGAVREQPEGIVRARIDVQGWQRAIHDLAHRPANDLGVAIGALEE